MPSTLITLLNSTSHKIPPERVWNDTSAFLKDPKKNELIERLGGVVDESVLSQYKLMDEIFPWVEENSFRVASMRIKENRSVASISMNDQPIPMTGAGQIEEALANLFKLSIGLSFNETDQIRFHELIESGRLTDDHLGYLTKNVGDLLYKIARLANVLTASVCLTGVVNWIDPRNSNRAQMTYNFRPELFPAPLTGGDRWSQAATARGIDGIIAHSDIFYLINGFRPKYIVLRTEAVRQLQRQRSTLDYAIALGIVNSQLSDSALISIARLRQIFEELQLPEIYIWDAQYEIEPQPGVFQRANFMPTNKYFFAHPRMGERIFGKTIEGKGKPGIFIDLDPKDKKRNEERVEAVARFIPFVLKPELLAAQTIDN